MRAVVQRVSKAGVSIESKPRIGIDQGLLILLGVRKGDTREDACWLAKKILGMRIFEDEHRKLNRSIEDFGGQLLVVSQFTLYGDCRKGRRPGFDQAAPPEVAIPLYERFIEELSASNLVVKQGEFGAMMDIDLINRGPVTLIVESPSPRKDHEES